MEPQRWTQEIGILHDTRECLRRQIKDGVGSAAKEMEGLGCGRAGVQS